MSIVSKIRKRRGRLKLGQKVYKKEYRKAAVEEMRKTRKRSRKQITEKARLAAKKKFGMTPSERRKARKEQIIEIGNRARDFLEDEYGEISKPKKKGKKKSLMKQGRNWADNVMKGFD